MKKSGKSSDENLVSKSLTSDDSDAERGDSAELHGALPPSAPDETTETATEPQPQENFPQGLMRWGPWRRWRNYREFRQGDDRFYGDRDPEENLRGRLPDDEGVQLPGIWTVELYTPSTVGGLLKGIRDLGWEYGQRRDDSLTKWMNDVREGRQAGWVSLGLVSPPNAAHIMKERSARLPQGVEAALPILMSLTPSITAFVVVFLFDEKSAASLEVSLRANFMTTRRRTSRFRTWHLVRYLFTNSYAGRLSYSIHTPDSLRRETLKALLQGFEKNCVQWVRKHFPGAFTSLSHTRHPTAVLFVTEQVRPLSDEARSIRALDGLAIGRNYDAWESIDWPGARLVMPRNWDDEGSRLTFACRRRDAFPSSPGYHDPSSNWTIATRANGFIHRLLSRWAITCLLDGYHETLSAMRDETARDGSYRTIRDLKRLRSFARTLLYDIGACTQEIEEFSQSPLDYKFDVIEMTYADRTHGGKQELLNVLRSSNERRARQIRREAILLQTTLSTSNDLSQTISNIRIQRFIVLLAVVSIGIALWGVFYAS